MGAKVAAVSFHDGRERVKFGRKGKRSYSSRVARGPFLNLRHEGVVGISPNLNQMNSNIVEQTRAHPRKFIRQRLLNCSETFTREQFGLGLKSGDGEDDEDEDEDEDEAMDRSFR